LLYWLKINGEDVKKFFNRAIRILLGTNWFIMVAGAMLGPIYALFVKNVGGSLLDASYAAAVFFLTGGIVTLISGRYSDRIKQNELILVLGCCIMGIGYFGYILVNSMWSLLVVQVLTSFGEAIYYPVFDVLYSKHSSKRQPGAQWGTWEALYYFTAAFGAITGGFLVAMCGFNTMFAVMGLLCFASAAYVFMLPRSVL
jgi:predicted MFS family arabinose efflux permease